MTEQKLELTILAKDSYKIAPSVISGSPRESFRAPHFAFATQNGKQVRNKTLLVYCRESLCEILRQELRGLTNIGIDTNKLRLVAWRRISPNEKTKASNTLIAKNQMLAGLTLVNTLERHYKWPLTKMYSIKIPTEAYNNVFYYIVASKRWMKSPAMLSLFTLLFRISVSERKFKFRSRVKNMKSLIATLKEMGDTSSYMEARYIAEHIENWLLVLANYKKLFGSRTIEDLYFPNDDGRYSYLFSEGINSLCDLDSRDTRLNKAFQTIVERNKK